MHIRTTHLGVYPMNKVCAIIITRRTTGPFEEYVSCDLHSSYTVHRPRVQCVICNHQ